VLAHTRDHAMRLKQVLWLGQAFDYADVIHGLSI